MPTTDEQLSVLTKDTSVLQSAMAAQLVINQTQGERHNEMMLAMNKTLDKLDRVSEQVGKMDAMQQRLSAVEEKANTATSDVRAAAHDARDAKQALGSLDILGKKVAGIEEWKATFTGVEKGVKGVWSILIAVGGGVAFVIGTCLTVYAIVHGQPVQISGQ